MCMHIEYGQFYIYIKKNDDKAYLNIFLNGITKIWKHLLPAPKQEIKYLLGIMLKL